MIYKINQNIRYYFIITILNGQQYQALIFL